MTISKKRIREITGYTHEEIGSDPECWIRMARLFKRAADLIATQDEYSPPLPFYYNAGVSLELTTKAIVLAKNIEIKPVHNLNNLVKLVDVEISSNQEITLELLSEMVVWAGRYPIPKTEEHWNNYHDVILDRHKINSQQGKMGSVLANQECFPTLENYHCLWQLLNQAYELERLNQ